MVIADLEPDGTSRCETDMQVDSAVRRIRLLSTLVAAWCVLLSWGAAAAQVSNLDPDDSIVFYPSYLTWVSTDGQWRGSIHGKVREVEDGMSAEFKGSLLRKMLGLEEEMPADEERLFRARARDFTVDNERGKRVVVQIGDATFVSRRSRSNGHFTVRVALSGGQAGDALPFAARLGEKDAREFGGALYLLASEGISVISDIDDTVKRSNVLDGAELLANTFLRPYRPVPGMAELYEAWREQDVILHYVTASPWQLHRPLWDFLTDNRFPGVEIQMRHLRLKDLSAVHFFRNSRRFKTERIREILARFPERRFVLVGDSGEQDPQVYAALAAEFPDRVRAIFIRAVLDEHRERDRYREIFERIDPSSWIIFHDADELPRDLAAWPMVREN